MKNFITLMKDKMFSYENERFLSDGQIVRRIRRYGVKLLLQELFDKNSDQDKLNISVNITGGIGDQVSQLQWVRGFLYTLAAENVKFCCILFGENLNSLKMLSTGIDYIDDVCDVADIDKYRFNLMINMNYTPLIDHIDWSAIERFAPQFIERFKGLVEQNRVMSRFKDPTFHYSVQEYALANNLGRYDLLGASGFFEFNRYSQPFFFIDHERVQATLEKFGLQDRTFITLHTGIGAIPVYGLKLGQKADEVKQFSTKVIPLDFCEQIFLRLKEVMPEVVLVQIGEPDGLKTQHSDLCLIGKSSFKESLDLLYAAAVHIDNDSGLVHVRHAMQKKSVVLWGPTSSFVLGHIDDVNLQGSCEPCMWLTRDWNLNCPKGLACAECMRSHSVESVVDGVKSILAPT